MQVPRREVAVLAIDPVRLASSARGDEVIALDFVAIPPAGLDALGTGTQLQLALQRGLAGLHDEPLRAMEEPGGAWGDWSPTFACDWAPAFAGVTRSALRRPDTF